MLSLLTSVLACEEDVVLCRQRTRHIAALMGFDPVEQTRIATAISEVARNTYEYAKGKGGKAEFLLDEQSHPQAFVIRISDKGSGIAKLQTILDGNYRSETGMGVGLVGARRLMDRFEIVSSAQGTEVTIGKFLPKSAKPFAAQDIAALSEAMHKTIKRSVVEEIQQQNQELLRTLQELEKRQGEMEMLNQELAETNRGVVALYAELDERAMRLKQADEVKTRFLSHMSHEFRTPVSSVLRLTEFLLDRADGELTGEQEKQVTLIRKSMTTLSDMINDLLDLAKVQAGKVTIRPEEVSVTKLFGALQGMFRPLFSSTDVMLQFQRPTAIPRIYTDEGKVAQILRNFISNALKFTTEGEIRVKAKYDADTQTAIFSVADTGIGIPHEHMRTIFEEFNQIEHSLQKKAKGTGLGLPLSKKLAELLGGYVEVESEPGKGSVFSLVLPLRYTGEAAPVILAQLPRAVVSPPERIMLRDVLIVDDEEASCYAIKRALIAAGCTVYEARDCETGLRLAREKTPGVIFLDLNMPGISGLEMLHCLRIIAVTRDIPVIIHSSQALSETQKGELRPITLDIISKHMEYDELQAYIGRLAALLPERKTA